MFPSVSIYRLDKFEAILSDRPSLFKPARYIDALVAANSSPGLIHLSLGNMPSQEDAPGEENGNPLQYSCPEDPMDRPWGHKESDTTEQLTFCNMTATWVPAAGTLRKNRFSRKRRESSVKL